MKKSEIRRCRWCDEPVPLTRKKTAWHCCDEHYDLAANERGINRYHKITRATKELKRNEDILDKFYFSIELNKQFFYEDLERKNFNFGVSEGVTAGPGNVVANIIGTYAYYIHPKTQIVTIWKLKSSL